MHDVVTSPERRSMYERDGDWTADTLAARVAKWAAQRPGDVAVVDGEGSHTYDQLGADASRVAGFLGERGVMPGEVVSVQLPNRYEAVVLAVAVQSLGAVINPLLPNYRAKRAGARLRDGRAPAWSSRRRATAASTTASSSTRSAARRVSLRRTSSSTTAPGAGDARFGDLLDRRHRRSSATGRAEAVSELIFTSGTEATPKAIMHTEQTANFSVRVAYSRPRLEQPTTWCGCRRRSGTRPASTTGSVRALPRAAARAAGPLGSGKRRSPSSRASGARYTLAATTFLQDLVAAAERLDVHLDTLRCFGCGGAPVPADLVRAAETRGIGVLRLYGSTEVLVAHLEPSVDTARGARRTRTASR